MTKQELGKLQEIAKLGFDQELCRMPLAKESPEYIAKFWKDYVKDKRIGHGWVFYATRYICNEIQVNLENMGLNLNHQHEFLGNMFSSRYILDSVTFDFGIYKIVHFIKLEGHDDLIYLKLSFETHIIGKHQYRVITEVTTDAIDYEDYIEFINDYFNCTLLKLRQQYKSYIDNIELEKYDEPTNT